MDPTRAAVNPEPVLNGNGHVHEESAEPESPLADAAGGYTCPQCGSAFSVDETPANNVLECPACGAQFFVPVLEYSSESEEEERLRREQEASREDELDAAHFKQVMMFRRSLNRTRSMYVIFIVALVVAAIQLVFYAVRRVLDGAGRDSKVLGFCFAAVVCLVWAFSQVRKIKAVNRELAESKQKDPDREPDFSTLSDGSERWKAIESLGDHRTPE